MADATVTNTTPLPPIPQDALDWKHWVVRAAQAINRFLRHEGTLNVTLAANAATSVVYDSRISLSTYIGFMPTSATAATAFASGSFYVTLASGSATINHPNTADTDKTFIAILKN